MSRVSQNQNYKEPQNVILKTRHYLQSTFLNRIRFATVYKSNTVRHASYHMQYHFAIFLHCASETKIMNK